MDGFNQVSLAYIMAWAVITLFSFVRTLLFHLKQMKMTENRSYRIHIQEHINVMTFILVSQLLLFYHFVVAGSALYEPVNVGHIALGVMTIANIYFFRHIRDEINCEEG